MRSWDAFSIPLLENPQDPFLFLKKVTNPLQIPLSNISNFYRDWLLLWIKLLCCMHNNNVQEIVWVAHVFAKPMNWSFKRRLNTLNNYPPFSINHSTTTRKHFRNKIPQQVTQSALLTCQLKTRKREQLRKLFSYLEGLTDGDCTKIPTGV